MQNVPLPEVVTEQTIASWLGVHPKTIWRWIGQGKFPRPVKLRGSKATKYWLAEEVAAWILEEYRDAQTKHAA